MDVNWQYKKFEELTATELYHILQLRNEVFVVEQNAIYQDADNKDLVSYHLCGWDNQNLAAYARIIPPGVAFVEASIGRVVTSPDYRKMKLGKKLMELSIKHTLETYNVTTIKIGAQLYLQQFYMELGFVNCSEVYMEDGIPHKKMILTR
jgi:ElaA protein